MHLSNSLNAAFFPTRGEVKLRALYNHCLKREELTLGR